MKMTAPGGWEVEAIVRDLGDSPAQWLRVKRCGYLVGPGYVQSPAEVEATVGEEVFTALAAA